MLTIPISISVTFTCITLPLLYFSLSLNQVGLETLFSQITTKNKMRVSAKTEACIRAKLLQ